MCSVAMNIIKIESESIMENIEITNDKVTETLISELESFSYEELHQFFLFFYRMNHQHFNMICPDQFEVFLETFDNNPFKTNENKQFRKQLIDSIIKYAFDYTNLLTAALLIKKKFTIEEIAQNYYANIDMFGGDWY